ncbi:MAG: hypothetical protein AAF915_02010 [Cyanobacteria bacterium P01_D01_bin.50]
MDKEIESIEIFDSETGESGMPPSDPSWSYATIWEIVHETEKQLKILQTHLASKEESSLETDKKIYDSLNEIVANCVTCCNLVGYVPGIFNDK